MSIKIYNASNDNTIFNTKNWVEYSEEVKVALEKQIPKKPLEQRYVNYEIKNELIGHCPACKLRWNVTYWQRHCSNCGQKLDWRVEE